MVSSWSGLPRAGKHERRPGGRWRFVRDEGRRQVVCKVDGAALDRLRLAPAILRGRPCDTDAAAFEVEVAPPQPSQLSEAQPGSDGGEHERPPPHPRALPQTEQLPRRQHSLEHGDVIRDCVGRKASELSGLVVVDQLRGDLVELQPSEHRQQMIAQDLPLGPQLGRPILCGLLPATGQRSGDSVRRGAADLSWSRCARRRGERPPRAPGVRSRERDGRYYRTRRTWAGCQRAPSARPDRRALQGKSRRCRGQAGKSGPTVRW